MSANYRRIYEQCYGPIPKDLDGRKYEIHHIDGNHSNDSPENLLAVTIQEHYNIHYSRGDWAACHRTAIRMQLSPGEISDLARKESYKRIANGTHNLLKRPDGTSQSSDRVANRTHNFITNNPIKKGMSQSTVTCPHCFKVGGRNAMKRWHFDNCGTKNDLA